MPTAASFFFSVAAGGKHTQRSAAHARGRKEEVHGISIAHVARLCYTGGIFSTEINVHEYTVKMSCIPAEREWLLWAQKEKLDSRVINFISQETDMLGGENLRLEEQGLEKPLTVV